jgi:hypothetical protein
MLRSVKEMSNALVTLTVLSQTNRFSHLTGPNFMPPKTLARPSAPSNVPAVPL